MHKVTMKNKVLKSLRKMPVAEQRILQLWLLTLRLMVLFNHHGPTTANLEKTNIIVTSHTSGLLVGEMRKTQ